MRLWHYKLIPFLPKSQLIAQWRELNSIYKKQDNHILINYVYEYPKQDLFIYSIYVMSEMASKNIKIKNFENFYNYFDDMDFKVQELKYPFANHHNDRYLLQCFYNLQEKFDRGQKDFTEENYIELEKFVRKEAGLL